MNKLLILFVTLFISGSLSLAAPFANITLSPVLREELEKVITAQVQERLAQKSSALEDAKVVAKFGVDATKAVAGTGWAITKFGSKLVFEVGKLAAKATGKLSLSAISNFIKNLPSIGTSAIKYGFSGIKSIPSLAIFPFKHLKNFIQVFPGKQLAISGYEAGLVFIWIGGAVIVVHATCKMLECFDVDNNNWFYIVVKSVDNKIFQ